MEYGYSQPRYAQFHRADHPPAQNERSVQWGLNLGAISKAPHPPPAVRSPCLPQKGILKGHLSNSAHEMQNRQSPYGTRCRRGSREDKNLTETLNDGTARVSPDDLVNEPWHRSHRSTRKSQDLQYSRQILSSVISEALHRRQMEDFDRRCSSFGATTMFKSLPSSSFDHNRPLPQRPFLSFPTTSPNSFPPYESSPRSYPPPEAYASTGSCYQPSESCSDNDSLSFEDALSQRSKFSLHVASVRKITDQSDPRLLPTHSSANTSAWVDAIDANGGGSDHPNIDLPWMNRGDHLSHTDKHACHHESQCSIDPHLNNPTCSSSTKCARSCSNHSPSGISQMNDEARPYPMRLKEQTSLRSDLRMPGSYSSSTLDGSERYFGTSPTGGQLDFPHQVSNSPKHHGSYPEVHDISSFVTPRSILITVLNQWEKTVTTAEISQNFVNQLRYALDSYQYFKSLTDSYTTSYPLYSCGAYNYHNHSADSTVQLLNVPRNPPTELLCPSPHPWTPSLERCRTPASVEIGRPHQHPERSRTPAAGEIVGKTNQQKQQQSQLGYLLPSALSKQDHDVTTSSFQEDSRITSIPKDNNQSVDSHVQANQNQRRRKNLEAFFGAKIDSSSYHPQNEPQVSPHRPMGEPKRSNNKNLEAFLGERILPSAYASQLAPELELSTPRESQEMNGGRRTNLATDLVKTMKGLKKTKISTSKPDFQDQHFSSKLKSSSDECLEGSPCFKRDSPRHHLDINVPPQHEPWFAYCDILPQSPPSSHPTHSDTQDSPPRSLIYSSPSESAFRKSFSRFQ